MSPLIEPNPGQSTVSGKNGAVIQTNGILSGPKATGAVVADESTPLLPQKTEEYSSFSTAQKTLIIFTAAFASTFSPFSANIYYPAINSIAQDLNVTAAMMNLTITAYMIFQGVAPTFMGNLSDTVGRRPVYLLCFGIYMCANVGLALQRNYWALLGFRALQSTGISATIALSNAVAADTVTSAERGTYLGIASLGGILGPALGPTLGGLISKFWAWYGIFWILALLSGFVFVSMLLFFPETCRRIVENGSVPPPSWNRSLINVIADWRKRKAGISLEDDYVRHQQLSQKTRIRFPNPLSTFRLLFEMPTSLVLLVNGTLFGAYYAITSSLPAEFSAIYRLNELQMGLTYIPIGLGTILSSFTNGWAIDWNFRRIAARTGGMPSVKNGKQDLTMFPIERSRLQIAIPSAISGAVCIAAYGWLLHFEMPLKVAILFLFLIGYFMTASYNVMNLLIVDLNYEAPATATAANNFVRCFIGAASTAGIIPLLEYMGRGPSYTILAAICASMTPLSIVVYIFGLHWRNERDARKADSTEG
ncbi:MFS efflux transporter, putative [Talaromyces stipitatus ATCC 10500]|uniref:MFS efflux transporter, putative n=1 Tax=Talaromyces stipitatus (strain ATCC 10500 / CBS 375.48 / QM 6759 / NRRL 1006) TaxID=441959 RepID=B8MCL9_TALSN|nr:MFS efflux transporter, putative [Talaromyces stipitatus ATCC 10500]EED18835.1 MFS efflux transporter, putative [Talaromyces stipitatus ATCC 10500]